MNLYCFLFRLAQDMSGMYFFYHGLGMWKGEIKELFHDLLHPAHLAVLQPHLDAVRMEWGIGQ